MSSISKIDTRLMRTLRIISLLAMIVGFALVALPHLEAWLVEMGMGDAMRDYEERVREFSRDEGRLSALLEAVDEYNRELDDSGQERLCDAWSYMEPSFDLSEWGIEDGVFAILKIPRADIEMPIYLGATEEHLGAGAAHLTQTSLPVRAKDGVSSNAVIAGHRGYRANTFFNNIPLLELNDEVFVDTFWGRVEYRVIETAIIDPSDIDAIKIRPDKTMLTLITCHPLYENTQRYVVYCEQVR